MNIRKIAAIIISCVFIASGCSAADSTSSETSASETEMTESSVTEASVSETVLSAETEGTAEETDHHAAMVQRSLYSTGDITRLKAKMEQAKSGEKTTIAYIGGSITEGHGVGAEKCYAKLSYDAFCNEYANEGNVEYVNAGLSGTPSTLGMLRLERDVLSHDPDIVFVEFAVNDSQDKMAKESYESLVKTVLMQENEPAVVLLLNVIESGYTAQAHMKEIGDFYELPIISAADALTTEFDEGRLEWRDYSNDGSHPNAWGSELLAEFIGYMYKTVDSMEADGDYTPSVGTKFGTPYLNSQMITPDNTVSDYISLVETGGFEKAQYGASGFPCCWEYCEGDKPLKLKATASAFFVIYRRNNTDGMGSFDVYVNGSKLKTVDTKQTDGWGEAFSEQIIKFSNQKEMDIEIRPSEGNTGTIEILGFACADNVSY